MKKKVFLLITRLDAGGSSEAVTALKKGLSDKYDITLLSGPGEQAPDILVPGLQREMNPLKDVIAFFQLLKLFRTHRPDLIHTNSSKAGFLGRWAAKAAGIRNVVHMPHGHVFYGYGFSPLKTNVFLLLERMSAPCARKLIALTEGEKSESLGFGIGKPWQWAVIHPGTDIPDSIPSARNRIRREMNIPEDALVAGTIARLEPVKGIINLIRAFRLFVESYPERACLLIVGDGGLKAGLVREAEKLGVGNKCVFAGFRKDIYELLSSMDIYVQPSLNEGLGKTVVQAQAAGLPVIATRVQGIPDAVKENETGILTAPADPQELAQAMLLLAGKSGKRKQMGENAKCWVREKLDGFPRFSTERMLLLTKNLYEEILK